MKQKKITLLLFMLVSVFTSMADNITAVKPTTGDGSTESPYEIASAENLVWFADRVNAGYNYICGKLTADVDLGETECIIGSGTYSYNGSFDGQKHKVTYHLVTHNKYMGLFGSVYGATIQNIKTSGTIYDDNTTDYTNYAGGIAAHCDSTKVSYCSSDVAFTFKTYNTYIGGIVGYAYSNTKIRNCIYSGTVIDKMQSPILKNIAGIAAGNTEFSIYNCLLINNSPNVFKYAIGPANKVNNCYYTSVGTYPKDKGTLVSQEELSSGYVCYKLNQGVTNGSQSWYQVIGTDAIPQLFAKEGGTVYCGEDVCPQKTGYSNVTHNFTATSDTINGIYTSICSHSGCHGVESYAAPEADSLGFYHIANTGHLIWFAKQVSEGNITFKARLTADIDLGTYQTMIGTSSYPYGGEFDGQGHSIRINYNTEASYTALFRYTKDASIHHLQTLGSITTSGRFAAGIVAYCQSTTLQYCKSSVAINSQVSGDGTHGGIVAHIATASTVAGCIYDGAFSGENTNDCGGIIGWSSPSITITNCLYVNNGTCSSEGSCTISRGNSVTCTDCYYTAAYGTEQGTLISIDAVKSGEICYKFNNGCTDGRQTWYQTIGEDDLPTFDTTHGTVYGGEDVCPARNGYGNVTHSATFDSNGVGCCQHEGCGVQYYQAAEYNSSTDSYDLCNKGNFLWFASEISNGWTDLNATLKTDIDLATSVPGTTSCQTTIGTQSHPYSGIFNGCDHTVTLNYTATEDIFALFRYTKEATIKQLVTAGNISSSFKDNAGIVGQADSTDIIDCWSKVNFTCSQGSNCVGGIVASTLNGGSISNCLYSGTVTSVQPSVQDDPYNLWRPDFLGGMVARAQGNISISNCLLMYHADNYIDASYSKSMVATNLQGVTLSLTNCYYCCEADSNPFDDTQGTAVTKDQVTTGEVCYALNHQVSNGTQQWYQVIGTEDCPHPVAADKTSGTVYGGKDACPSTLSYSNHHHHNTVTEGADYTLTYTCSNEDCGYTYTTSNEPQYDSDNDTYLLKSTDDFKWFQTQVNSGLTTLNARLVTDIDISSLSSVNEGYLFNTFSGKLSGENASGDDFVLKGGTKSLFHHLSGAEISHLTFYNFNMTNQTSLVARTSSKSKFRYLTAKSCALNAKDYGANVGMMCGYSQGDAFYYCTVDEACSVKSERDNIGGIAGYSETDATFSYCYNAANVTASGNSHDCAGSMVGRSVNTYIDHCLNTGDIRADDNVGGIVGLGTATTISYSVTTGIIELTDIFDGKVGGIIGLPENCICTNCYVFGQVNGIWTGLLCFPITGYTSATINNCHYYCTEEDFLCNNFGWKMTDEYLQSGAYSLNSYWLYQDIDNGKVNTHYPVPIPAAGKVYTNTLCNGTQTYSNKYHSPDAHTSNIDVYGYCTTCGQYLGTHELHAKNAAFLCDLAKAITDGRDYTNSTIYLDNDIDFTGVNNYTPIGCDLYPYHGTFDGQGHRIKNLIFKGQSSYTGFFGLVGGRSSESTTYIKNLIIDASCSITSNGSAIAGLVGCVTSYSGNECKVYIENCGNEAAITGVKNVAGILGAVYNNDNTQLQITNSYNTGAIKAEKESATICANTKSYYVIDNCYNTGTLEGADGTNYLVRIGSSSPQGTITHCYNTLGGSAANTLTETDVNTGKLCCLLNSQTNIWTQNLEDNGSHPIFGTDNLTYTRNIKANFGTIVLPFQPVSYPSIKFYNIEDDANTQENVIRLTEVTEPQANVPYIFQYIGDVDTENGVDITITAGSNSAVSSLPSTPTNANGNWTLTGTYAQKTKNGATDNFYYVAATSGTFYKAQGNTSFAPFRAWATYSGSNPSKSFTIQIGDKVTGIHEVLNDTCNGICYDLNGKKVTQPQHGQIYIIDGKKIAY